VLHRDTHFDKLDRPDEHRSRQPSTRRLGIVQLSSFPAPIGTLALVVWGAGWGSAPRRAASGRPPQLACGYRRICKVADFNVDEMSQAGTGPRALGG
jgi:hypothetical protein